MSRINTAKNLLLVASVTTSIFLAGRLTAPPKDLAAAVLPGASSASLAPVSPLALPQGRSTKRGSGADTDLGTGTDALVYESGSTGAASADGFLAVTGSYGIGTQVLYLVDTKTRQLAVYEARGGSVNSRRLRLIGARRIDLDLQLEGYNDDSEFSFEELRRKFDKSAPRGPVTPDKDAEDKKSR
ncbi:MAG: hypothetical protein H6832_03720 [Planctomycetes bacterium]|nr:hypothetical protein [Planctomycetota bacterium]